VKRSHLQEEMETKRRLAERALQKVQNDTNLQGDDRQPIAAVEATKTQTSWLDQIQLFLSSGRSQKNAKKDDDLDIETAPVVSKYNNHRHQGQFPPVPSAQPERYIQLLRSIQSSTNTAMHSVITSVGHQQADMATQSWANGYSVVYLDRKTASIGKLEESTPIYDCDDDQIDLGTNEAPTRLIAEFRETLNLKNPDELFTVAEGSRFIHHAAAIYTWSTVRRQTSIEIAIAKKSDPTYSRERGRNLQCLRASSIPNVRVEDIRYTQFHHGIHRTPYAIVCDHSWQSIVVSIRGSASIEDMLTDFTMKPAELKEIGEQYGFEGADRYCHRGVLDRVLWIYDDIQRNSNLEHLLSGKDLTCKGYRLRVTGHSLGAACAALLTLLLRVTYKRVKCLAFSPPGCTVCYNLSREMQNCE